MAPSFRKIHITFYRGGFPPHSLICSSLPYAVSKAARPRGQTRSRSPSRSRRRRRLHAEPYAGDVSSREVTRGLIRRGDSPFANLSFLRGASCGTGLAEDQLTCCLSPLGGLVYPTPGHDPADFESCVNQVHLGDPPGAYVDQVDRREYSGSTHAESARLTNAAGR